MFHGLLVVDKPSGITSRDLVNQVQRLLPRTVKIGHTGTLDPLATGVLVLCIGAATKQAAIIQGLGKSYRARIRLGARSNTDDADGVVTVQDDTLIPNETKIDEALQPFLGRIMQRPPAYSAVKVGGRRAHALARRGQTVEISPRWVQIDSIRRLNFDWPMLDLEIECGKGTYIRSLARDLGERLGVGGLIQSLRRTRVGPFKEDHAVLFTGSMAEDRSILMSKLLPIEQVAELISSPPRGHGKHRGL